MRSKKLISPSEAQNGSNKDLLELEWLKEMEGEENKSFYEVLEYK